MKEAIQLDLLQKENNVYGLIRNHSLVTSSYSDALKEATPESFLSMFCDLESTGLMRKFIARSKIKRLPRRPCKAISFCWFG
jgi:hypothetical protein